MNPNPLQGAGPGGGPQNMPTPATTGSGEDIVNNVFGLVIPGRPVITQFKQAGPNKFLTEIHQPATAGEMTLFLQPGQVLPPSTGIAIYWSYPPFTEWQTLGTLPPNQASEIFSTGWPHLTELQNVPTVQLGVSVEDASMIANLSQAVGTQKTHENRLQFAKLVAQNLFRYLESFSQTTPEGERLVLPMSALERWLQRFEQKYRADPNFLSSQS